MAKNSPTVEHVASGCIVGIDIKVRTKLVFHFEQSDYAGLSGSFNIVMLKQFPNHFGA